MVTTGEIKKKKKKKKKTDWDLQNESHCYKWHNQQIQGICWDKIIVQMCL